MYKHKNGISFRKVSISDIEFLYHLKEDTLWGVHETFMKNMEDQKRWIENLDESKEMFFTIWYEKERFGVFSYTNIDLYHRCCRYSGSGTRKGSKKQLAFNALECGIDFAFEILNLNRIEADIIAYNVPSLKLNLNLGLKIEGTRKKAVYKSGVYYDSHLVAMLREDWQSSSRIKDYHGSCNLTFNHNLNEKLIQRFQNKICFE